MDFVVYDPPAHGFPFLAVVLHEGKVLLAEPVDSPDQGERLIAHLAEEMARRLPAKK